MISERLFSVLDKDLDKYLDLNEFVDGMCSLFSGDYERLTRFIFNLYDFNKDGKISKDDIRIVLSYIPLHIENKTSDRFSNEEYKDRIESQNEIFYILEKAFGNKSFIDYEQFIDIDENISSEIFLYVLFFHNF